MDKHLQVIEREKLRSRIKLIKALFIVQCVVFAIMVLINIAMAWYSFNNWMVIGIIAASMFINYKNLNSLNQRLKTLEKDN